MIKSTLQLNTMANPPPSTTVCHNQGKYDKNEVDKHHLLSYYDDTGKQVTRHLPFTIRQANNDKTPSQPTIKQAQSLHVITPEQNETPTISQSHNIRRDHQRQQKRQKNRRSIW